MLFLTNSVPFNCVLLLTYGKCSKILNTFIVAVTEKNVGYQGWNSQNAFQNSKQGRP